MLWVRLRVDAALMMVVGEMLVFVLEAVEPLTLALQLVEAVYNILLGGSVAVHQNASKDVVFVVGTSLMRAQAAWRMVLNRGYFVEQAVYTLKEDQTDKDLECEKEEYEDVEVVVQTLGRPKLLGAFVGESQNRQFY